MHDLAPIVVRTKGLEWRLIDGEVVILDLRTERFLGLNRTGAALWPLLQAGTVEDELVQALVEKFEVDVVTARRDVEVLLDQLAKADLLGDARHAPPDGQ